MQTSLFFPEGIQKIVFTLPEEVDVSVMSEENGVLRLNVTIDKKEHNEVKQQVNIQPTNKSLCQPNLRIIDKISENVIIPKYAAGSWLRLNDEQRQDIKEKYMSGKSLRAIALDYETTSHKIEVLLRKMGVKLWQNCERSARLSEKEAEVLEKLLRAGIPKDVAADHLGITFAQVQYFCYANNLKV